ATRRSQFEKIRNPNFENPQPTPCFSTLVTCHFSFGRAGPLAVVSGPGRSLVESRSLSFLRRKGAAASRYFHWRSWPVPFQYRNGWLVWDHRITRYHSGSFGSCNQESHKSPSSPLRYLAALSDGRSDEPR